MPAVVFLNLKTKMGCGEGGFMFYYVCNLHFHVHFNTAEMALPESWAGTLGSSPLCSPDPRGVPVWVSVSREGS